MILSYNILIELYVMINKFSLIRHLHVSKRVKILRLKQESNLFHRDLNWN
jgi:hypothetical protein